MGVFTVLIGPKSCVYTCMYRRFTSVDPEARYMYMNPGVLKKCLKLCFMKFWACLGWILQQNLNCLQGSYTNLEFNTWPILRYVGLLTFRTIRVFFPIFDMYRDCKLKWTNLGCSLNQRCKMSQSQVNIFIIFITIFIWIISLLMSS